MKEIKNYVLIVDGHRRPSRKRNTAGRYRVGAKCPNEAIKLLREKIGFGSIKVLYEDTHKVIPVKYKEVLYESVDGVEIPHHANEPYCKNAFLYDDGIIIEGYVKNKCFFPYNLDCGFSCQGITDKDINNIVFFDLETALYFYPKVKKIVLYEEDSNEN